MSDSVTTKRRKGHNQEKVIQHLLELGRGKGVGIGVRGIHKIVPWLSYNETMRLVRRLRFLGVIEVVERRKDAENQGRLANFYRITKAEIEYQAKGKIKEAKREESKMPRIQIVMRSDLGTKQSMILQVLVKRPDGLTLAEIMQAVKDGHRSDVDKCIQRLMWHELVERGPKRRSGVKGGKASYTYLITKEGKGVLGGQTA